MKETAKIHLDLLKKKEENLQKTLLQLEEKNKKLMEQYENAEKSLERIREQIANFGVSRPRSSSSTIVQNSDPEEVNISKSSQETLEGSSIFGRYF